MCISSGMTFPEEFLHFIWQFRLYVRQICTVSGDTIEVINPGMPNKNAGPDFSNAKLVIGNTTWAGQVEIHILASDWLLHQHQNDEAYENVILHVVYENDTPIFRQDGSALPILVIKDLFDPDLLQQYEKLISSLCQFPCEKQIREVEPLIVRHFLSRILIERFIEKSEEIAQQLAQCTNDWESVFYYFLAKNFGFKVNAVPMELMAQAIPHQLYGKHKNQPLQIEALIFGQAGFLNQQFAEEYPNKLKREYQFLKQKYGLKSISISLWKFLRMRPQNFPTLRLAQLGALITNSNRLLSKILTETSVAEIEKLFHNLPVNPFWEKHYHFHKKTNHVNVQLGKQTIENILINTVSLFLFAYGKTMDQYELINRSLALLEQLPAENNAIIEQYREAGVKIDSAFVSQALLQLKKKYCNEKKCLNCTIGIKILRK
jgi:hypothetical protein